MADISSYPRAIPAGDDLILGSQADEAGVHHTKTFTTQSVANLGSGGGGGGNQNLQSVLTTGNRYLSPDGFGTFTLNELTNNNGNISYTNLNEGWGYRLNAEDGLVFTDELGNATGNTRITPVSIVVGTGGPYVGTIETAISANRNYQLPNASGTIALTSDLSNYTNNYQDQDINGEWTFNEDLTIDNAELLITGDSPKVKYIDTTSGGDLFFEETVGVTNYTTVARRQVWDNIAGQGIKTTFNALTAGGTRHWQYQNDFAWSVNDTEEVLRIKGNVNGTGKVGIKTTNPQAELDVNGEIRSSGNLRIAKSFPSIELQHTPTGSSNGRLIKFLEPAGIEVGSIRSQVGPDGGGDPGITIETDDLYKTHFRVGQGLFEWKMYEGSTSTFEKAMWLAPKVSSVSRLTLYGGDIELDEASRGVILKSPNGTRYKLTVDNAGNLAVTAV